SGRLPRACCSTATRPAPGSCGSPTPILHALQRTRAILLQRRQRRRASLLLIWPADLADADVQVCNSWLCRAALCGDVAGATPFLCRLQCSERLRAGQGGRRSIGEGELLVRCCFTFSIASIDIVALNKTRQLKVCFKLVQCSGSVSTFRGT
ncbi:hypothetical protein ZWY2020_038545, partial [Hordeum vulgare]